ncbi:MAG: hypothetical protein LCH53_04995 [Bacteroidetes bacterium]|nr:hypothetical protein [Bacteroidota bacterium]
MPRHLRLAAGLALVLAGCDLAAPPTPRLDNPYDFEQPGGARALDIPPAPRLQSATSTTATLTWDDRSDAENAYLVERKYGIEAWKRVVTLPANTTSFTDTTLIGSRPVLYRLRTISPAITSAPSDSLQLVWPGYTRLPIAMGLGETITQLGSNLLFTSLTAPRLVSMEGTEIRRFDALLSMFEEGPVHYAFNASGTLLARSNHVRLGDTARAATASIRVVDVQTGQLVAQFVAPPYRTIQAITFADDATLYLHGYDQTFLGGLETTEKPVRVLWNVRANTFTSSPFSPNPSATLLTTFPPPEGLFSRFLDGNPQAFALTFAFHNVRTGQTRWSVDVATPPLSSLPTPVVSPPRDEFALGYAQNQITVYDMTTGSIRKRITPPPLNLFGPRFAPFSDGTAYPVAFSHNRQRILFASTALAVLDRNTERILRIVDTTLLMEWGFGIFTPNDEALVLLGLSGLYRMDLNAVWTAAP